MNYFDEHDARSLETSVEILQAISESAQNYDLANEIWREAPYNLLNRILARAFELTDDEELYWGESSFRRDRLYTE